MSIIKKILIGLSLIIFVILFCFIFYLKITYIDRAENGLKYKTYEYINENNVISTIELTENYIIFNNMDFLEIYKTIATIKLAKENGIEFNILSQEEKDSAIDLEVKEMVYNNILQRNKEYSYTYYPETGLISIISGDYEITLSFSDEKFVKLVPGLKKPGLTLYNKLFY